MNFLDDEFYDVVGYEGLYKINTIGAIKSCDKYIDNKWGGKSKRIEKFLSPSIDKNGYLRVVLTKNKKTKTFFIHKLVALTFLEDPQNKKIINHIDKNKKNNYYKNLEWCTCKENVRHSIEEYVGSGNGNSKINETVALYIKKVLKFKKLTISEISKNTNISKWIIADINRNKNWKHVIDYSLFKVKEIKDTFNDYKKSSIYICGTICNLDCKHCFNKDLRNKENVTIETKTFIKKYILNNNIKESIVMSGLNWFDEFDNLLEFVAVFRNYSDIDIVIYTGNTECELYDKLKFLKQFPNIIVKFGRYMANSESIYDDILGVTLASNNQYAVKIS